MAIRQSSQLYGHTPRVYQIINFNNKEGNERYKSTDHTFEALGFTSQK